MEARSTPHKITQRLGQFEGAILRILRLQRGKSNLTKFQASILQQIRGNPNIIIAHADKNLGPVGINTEQYIHWALDKHLSDSETYVQVSEGDAQLAASDLYKEIYQWTRKHGLCERLTKDATDYIRHNTMKNRADPFGYFYLTIKSTRLLLAPDLSALIARASSIPSVNGSTLYFSPSLHASPLISRTHSPSSKSSTS